MAHLNINIETVRPDICLVTLSGVLDSHTFTELDDAVRGLFEQGRIRIACNLANLEYLSSTGAGVFVDVLDATQARGGSLVLFGATQNVRHILETLGLTTLFTLVDTRDDALRAFAAVSQI